MGQRVSPKVVQQASHFGGGVGVRTTDISLLGSPGHKPGCCWWCQSPHLVLSSCIAHGLQMESLPGAGQQFLPLVVQGVVSGMMWGENDEVPLLWRGITLEEELLILALPLTTP